MPELIPPETCIDDLVQRIDDIIEVIGNRIDLSKDKQGKEYKGLCPFHD